VGTEQNDLHKERMGFSMSNCLANLDQSLEGLEIDCTALKKATCQKISLLKTPTLAGTCTCTYADSFEPPFSANRPFIDQTTSIETSATAGVVQRQQRPATATDAVKASSVLLVYYFVIFAVVVAMQNMSALKVVEQHQQHQRHFSQVAVQEETSGKITSNAACGAAACEVIHPWTTASTCTCNGLLGYKQCGKENFTNETALKNKTDARPKFFNTAIKKNELCSDIETNEGIITCTFKAQTIEAKFRNLKRYSFTSLGKHIHYIFPQILKFWKKIPVMPLLLLLKMN